MVAAGEAGGILDTILLRLATFLEKNDALVRKVKGAMVYPGVIITVAFVAIAVLLDLRHSDVPEHVRIGQPRAAAADSYRHRDVQLPDPLLVGHDRPSIGGIIFAIRQYYGTPAGRKQLDGLLLKAPGAGRRDPEVGGVALHPDAGHAGQLRRLDPRGPRDHGQDRGQPGRCTTPSWSPASRSRAARPSPRRSRSRRSSRPMVISMIAVGEQTGGLDEMLSKIADFYDEEVDVAVSALLSLMEPAMIVILGVIVGGMVVAMYLPIFDMMNAVQ